MTARRSDFLEEAPTYDDNVFLNAPFDATYREIFRGLVFAIHDCGFVCRCALEVSNSADVRVDKLYSIIRESCFGIHDISRVKLDRKHRLPRFNMPLELGFFLGAREFGNGAQKKKNCLVLDTERYRYQIFCSDIGGQDIKAHSDDVAGAIVAVRDWLSSVRAHPRGIIPGGTKMAQRYAEFREYLPLACRKNHLALADLTFIDYRTFLTGWLQVRPW